MYPNKCDKLDIGWSHIPGTASPTQLKKYTTLANESI